MEKYEKLEIEVIEIKSDDVIITSTTDYLAGPNTSLSSLEMNARRDDVANGYEEPDYIENPD